MQVYILSQGYEIWSTVENGYTAPTSPPIDEVGKKHVENDAKATNAILSGLLKSVYVMVMGFKTTKELWGKLQNIFEGDTKVKEEKLQFFRAQFEQLKMREDKNIAAYFLRVNEVTNALEGLGEPLDEKVIV